MIFSNFYNCITSLYGNVYTNNKSEIIEKQSGIEGFLNQIEGVDENGIEISNTFHFTTGYKNADYVESDYLLVDGKKYKIRSIINKKLFDISYTKLVLRIE